MSFKAPVHNAIVATFLTATAILLLKIVALPNLSEQIIVLNPPAVGIVIGIYTLYRQKNKTKVILGQCVAGFQPSEKLCKKLIEEYNWELFEDHRGEIEEQRESEEYYEAEQKYGIEAIRKEIFHHEDGETSTDWRFFTLSKDEKKELRTHPDLIEAVKELGEKATENNKTANIAEIPSGIDWYITENDAGYEWVAEEHRTWTGEEV